MEVRMTEMLLVKSHPEEDLMLTLIQEFGSKVILPRNFQTSDTFKKYAKEGIYGIMGVELDPVQNEALYEVALPKAYLQYIDYELQKLRKFLDSAKEKKTNTQT
jgi:predicted mannosyl-3-phosphoglycerate phosphatase (HAD superfamily)